MAISEVSDSKWSTTRMCQKASTYWNTLGDLRNKKWNESKIKWGTKEPVAEERNMTVGWKYAANERWEMASQTKRHSQHIHFPSLHITTSCCHSWCKAEAINLLHLSHTHNCVCVCARMSLKAWMQVFVHAWIHVCKQAIKWASVHRGNIMCARDCACVCERESVCFKSKIKSHCLSPQGDDVIPCTASSNAGKQLTLLGMGKSHLCLAAAAWHHSLHFWHVQYVFISYLSTHLACIENGNSHCGRVTVFH